VAYDLANLDIWTGFADCRVFDQLLQLKAAASCGTACCQPRLPLAGNPHRTTPHRPVAGLVPSKDSFEEKKDMTVWLREIAGWMLMIIGLWLFWECYQMLVPAPVKLGPDNQIVQPPGKILEGAELALVGIIVFRGGIGLLKSALAARVCAPALTTTLDEVPKASRMQERLYQKT
jgi:hypothetical protein